MEQDADHARQRSGHLDLLRAEQRHGVEAEVSRRDRGELRVQVGRGAEDAAHHLIRAELVAAHDLVTSSRGAATIACSVLSLDRDRAAQGIEAVVSAASAMAGLSQPRGPAAARSSSAGAAAVSRRPAGGRAPAARTRPLEGDHRIADRLEHAPHDPVAPLVDRRPRRTTLGPPVATTRTRAGAVTVIELDPLPQRWQRPLGGRAGDRAAVALLRSRSAGASGGWPALRRWSIMISPLLSASRRPTG